MDTKQRVQRTVLRQALIHALCYALLAGFWVSISDYFITLLYADVPQILTLQTYKGLSFVAFTSILLFGLLYHHYQRFDINESILKQTVQKYRNLVETSSDLIWSIDAEGRITFINQASEQVYGRKPEEMIGSLYTDFIPPSQVGLHTQAIEIAVNNNDRIQNFENWVLHKDGHHVLLSANAIVLRDKHGQITGSMGTSRDITAQKATEKQLRFQSNLLNSVQQAVIATDLDGNIIYWNDFAEQLYGWTQAEVSGQPITTITVPEISQSQAEKIMTEVEEKGVWRGEFIVTRKDGSVFPALVTNSSFYDKDGHPAGVIGLSIDISEQKQMESELREVLQHQRELTVQANILRNIAEKLVHSTQTYTGLKAGVEELYSILDFDTLSIYSIEQNKLIPLVHQDNGDVSVSVEEIGYTEYAPLHSALSMGQTLHLSDVRENALLRSAMKIYDDAQEWIAIPLISRGITMGLLCASKHTSEFSESQREILETFSYQVTSALDSAQAFTDLQRSYQKLQLAQEKTVQATRLSVIGEIAAGVAHQINNPLMTVIADSHLLLKNIEQGSPMRESAEAINRAAHKAGNIVQRLLNFARTTPTDMAEMNINESIQQTINLVKSQIEPHYAQFNFNFAAGIPPFLGSEEHLQDVWMNLLLNARDAVRDVEAGRIQVATAYNSENDVIEVVVSDNGIGIDAASLANIFDPFYTTKERGTGLGLSICADIIRQHQGTIQVTSKPGYGSRFIVQLPPWRQLQKV